MAGNQPNRHGHENIRQTQSLHFSSPEGNHYNGGTSQGHPSGNATHMPSTSFPQDNSRNGTRAPSGFAGAGQTHLPRSWSEDNSAASPPRLPSPPKSSFLVSNGLWNIQQSHPDITVASAHSAVPSHTTAAYSSVTRLSDRVVSSSVHSHPSLTGYSGNRTELTARVGSVPQHTIFGSDKYEQHSRSTMARHDAHSNREMSHHSQYDGAMDDLAELAGTPIPNTMNPEPVKHR